MIDSSQNLGRHALQPLPGGLIVFALPVPYNEFLVRSGPGQVFPGVFFQASARRVPTGTRRLAQSITEKLLKRSISMSELFHECGVAAIYHLPGVGPSPLCPEQGPGEVSRLIPRMLLDIQNRGQLSAGMTSYNPDRNQLIDTYKDLGGVSEVFRLSHRGKAESLMRRYAGQAAIGHVRYATCGCDDRSYAQPFERHHVQKQKWFSFAFNGQLANYQELRENLLADSDNHLARDTDTEIIMHEIGRELSGDRRPALADMMRSLAPRFDGAYSLVMLNALGDMLVARDPLGPETALLCL